MLVATGWSHHAGKRQEPPARTRKAHWFKHRSRHDTRHFDHFRDATLSL